MRALAVSHLEEISDDGILAMAESKSIAVILPTTAYILRWPGTCFTAIVVAPLCSVRMAVFSTGVLRNLRVP